MAIVGLPADDEHNTNTNSQSPTELGDTCSWRVALDCVHHLG
jgi:hypothetical protein